MPEKKTLIIMALAILLGFAMGRCQMCTEREEDCRRDGGNSGPPQMMQPEAQRMNQAMPPDGGNQNVMPQTMNTPQQNDMENTQDGHGTNTGNQTNSSCNNDKEQSASGNTGENQNKPESLVRQSEEVLATLKGAMPKLKACHDSALKLVPELKPNFELRVFYNAVGGKGSLSGLKAMGSTTLPAEVLSCFIDKLSEIEIDLSQSRDGDESVVTLQLEFEETKK